MKKSIYILLTFLATSVSFTFAQDITATGTVQNNDGKAVPSALVQVNESKTATYTDANGYFSLQAPNSATLVVVASGYRDESVKAGDNLVIVLKPGKSSVKKVEEIADPNKAAYTPPATNAQNGFESTNFAAVAGHGMLSSFSTKEETRGSRYLFNQWTKGYVIDDKGQTIKSDLYAFNYDKISGSLLLTQDKLASVEVDKDKIKSFTVYNKLDLPLTFAMVPQVDSKHFTQVLSDGSKYKVYKHTKTTFAKSDFRSDGLTQSGNKYDEYVDEDAYYVMDAKSGQMQEITLRSKAIKKAFAADADKVKIFYSQHSDDDINEAFLGNLADYLNN
jgi:hypothetical protein